MKPLVRILFFLIFSLVLQATTITVINTDDNGTGSLRQAILDTVSGDDIDFSVTGTIVLRSQLPDINHSISIVGPGMNDLILDVNNSQFRHVMARDGNISISGISFINGGGNGDFQGGSIYVASDANLTIDDCNFTNNIIDAGHGGAIALYNGAITTVQNSYFSNNSAGWSSGAISVMLNSKLLLVNSLLTNNSTVGDGGVSYVRDESNVTIEDCNFTNNSSSGSSGSDGGVLHIGDSRYDETNVIVRRSSFKNNHANASGGAFYILRTVTIEDSSFVDNYASNGSGAIEGGIYTTIVDSNFTGNYTTGGDAGALTVTAYDGYGGRIERCNFTANTAPRGGAIYIRSGSWATAYTQVIDSNFTNNSSTGNGGAVYFHSSTKTSFMNTTFHHNNASGHGGAFFAANDGSDGILDINNSTFYDNNATSNGGGLYFDSTMNKTTVNIVNSTISENVSSGSGAGLYNNMSSPLKISHTTIANNSASSLGGGILTEIPIEIKNILLYENVAGLIASNCDGNFTTYHNNAVSNMPIACIFTPATPFDPTNPLLVTLGTVSPVGDYGGPTPTNLIVSDLNITDMGECSTIDSKILLIDQRGTSRPQGLGCDIGTVELVSVGESIPIAATDLNVTSTTSSKVSFSWTDNAFNEDSYRIYRDNVFAVSIPANSTDFTDMGLDSNTSYTYRVRASNSVGESESIEELNATTLVLVDDDNDGIGNDEDNCPINNNPDQSDIDGDGIGDVCDVNNNDGPLGDLDGDGIANQDDPDNNDGPLGDSDGDGIANQDDSCPDDIDNKCHGYLPSIIYLLE